MSKTEKLSNYTQRLGGNGQRLASICLDVLRIRSKIDFIPIFKKTMTSNIKCVPSKLKKLISSDKRIKFTLISRNKILLL